MLRPITLRGTVRRLWISGTRCYRSPCWWRSSLPRCCSRGRTRKTRWCSSACAGRWWGASAGTPAGWGRATHKRTHCRDVLAMRRLPTWMQTLGRNGGKFHCPLERLQCHCGPPPGHPSLTSWLKFWPSGREKKKMKFIVKQQNCPVDIFCCLWELAGILFLPPGHLSMADARWHSFQPHA